MLQELYASRGDKRQTKSGEKSLEATSETTGKKSCEERRLDIPGSCTEGQISHVLSERFSQDPMGWSEECLGKLSQARVYLKKWWDADKRRFQREG